ncbi:MAG TPA: hypothetical protein VGX50_04180 [Longimicrobium sp.]|jgi:hypothetical protein|nr:hypothetical protein [Longimicrobium sp.]
MSRAILAAALLAASVAACADKPTDPERPGPEPKPAPLPLGLYEITITGADGSGGGAAQARLLPSSTTPSMALNPAAAGLSFEQVSVTTFIEGSRTTGGQRFVSATFRVRNQTGAPLTNLTLIPVARTSAPVTISNTPFSTLLRFDGTAVPDSVATYMVPTGAVTLGDDGKIRSPYADVLQVFTEAEVAAIALPAGTSTIFPYGFVARNASNPASRAIPAAASANDWTGLFTWSFRYPLQPTAAADPFTIGFQFLAVQDTEVRMTESVEERQDSSGVRKAREKATALGATTVTVLGGSAAADPFVTDYPGQRQICSFRTAGTAASPVRLNTMPGFYTELGILRTGESADACSAYYLSGTATPANYGMSYGVTVRAMDRYGNLKTTAVDSVQLASTDGTATMPGVGALVSGSRAFTTSYTTYGNSTLTAIGRRLRGTVPMFVNGMTRTWGGTTSTMWLTQTNWTNGMFPGVQDSVIVPGDKPNYPLLVANTTTRGVTMTSGASVQPFINLSSFDLTVAGDVALGSTGTFTGTGRLVLTGTSNTIGGGLSNFDVRNLRITETGRYSTSSNINVTGGRIVVQGGRLRSTGNRVRVRPS